MIVKVFGSKLGTLIEDFGDGYRITSNLYFIIPEGAKELYELKRGDIIYIYIKKINKEDVRTDHPAVKDFLTIITRRKYEKEILEAAIPATVAAVHKIKPNDLLTLEIVSIIKRDEWTKYLRGETK